MIEKVPHGNDFLLLLACMKLRTFLSLFEYPIVLSPRFSNYIRSITSLRIFMPFIKNDKKIQLAISVFWRIQFLQLCSTSVCNECSLVHHTKANIAWFVMYCCHIFRYVTNFTTRIHLLTFHPLLRNRRLCHHFTHHEDYF